MTVLPPNLVFTRTYMEPMGPYLRSRGYNCTFNNISKMEAAQKTLPPNSCIVLWSGGYRRTVDDNYIPTPNKLFVEQGFLPHYTSINFDPVGHGGNSSLVGNINKNVNARQQQKLANFYRQYYFTNDEVKVDIPKKYWLLPLQHIQDSTMVFDAPAYTRNYPQLINSIKDVLPSGVELLVKPHPLFDTKIPIDVPTIASSKESGYNNSLNQHLLRNTEGVICVNSSYVYEALVYDKPVITLGTGIFTNNGVTKEVSAIDKTLFDNLVCDKQSNKNFMYELCINKQILFAHCEDRDKVAKIWENVEQSYSNFWELDNE